MQWHETDDVEEYAAAVSAFLEAEPASRNVPRWIIELARAGGDQWTGPPVFWWLRDGDRAAGAVSWTPPFGLHLTSFPHASAPPLVAAVRARAAVSEHPVAAFGGPRRAAAAVAAAWEQATGVKPTLHMAQLLHVLTEVHAVPAAPGARRLAEASDLDLLTAWITAFADEAGVPRGADPAAMVAAQVERRHCHVWVDGGVPVSMASRREPIVGVVRVGPVYTPPERRARGYATSLVAEVSSVALAEPETNCCMLFTDVANPVSNSIYRRIGYRPVEEHASYDVSDPR